MSDELIINLGYYIPVKYTLYDIELGLSNFCLGKGWRLSEGHWAVRNPKYNKSINSGNGEVTGWHHDPTISDDQPRYIAVWSNATPTLIKLPDGGIVEPKRWEVIIFDNIVCEHRMPTIIHPGRYFARGWDIRYSSKRQRRLNG